MKVIATLFVGSVVLVVIDKVLKIDMSKYPAWKRIVHVVAYALYGAAIAYVA